MKQFPVEDELVSLLWQLAKPAPFENLTFSDALRRVLVQAAPARKAPSADEMLAELAEMDDDDFARKYPSYDKPRRRVRSPSPDARLWLGNVPELASMPNLKNWVDICRHLKIEVEGDSARRKLAEWVAAHRPQWPQVPAP